MKRKILLVLLLFFCSLCSGYLLSKASLTGKIGIDFFYRQYRFLKDPITTTLIIFILYILLFLLHLIVYKHIVNPNSNWISKSILLLGILGALITYYDFQNTLSHKLLGTRFHLGGYLFWLGWILIPTFFLINSKKANQ